MNQAWRKKREILFRWLCQGITFLAVVILLTLLYHIIKVGFHWISWSFFENFPSRHPQKAGLKSALYGTVWLISLTALMSVPIGVATALYLEEYAPKKRWMRYIQLNIFNLAGMPSIVFGLVGLAVFVRFFQFDRSLLAGSMTLSLLILPVIIISSQEAIRAVPDSLRFAAYALGARRWQVVIGQILPAALPGIMTGFILALSRAIGETAPLIIIGALSYVAFVPQSPMDPFTVLPVQIFNWAGRPQEEFHGIAAAGIIVLLLVLFSMNFIAIIIRQRFQRYKVE